MTRRDFISHSMSLNGNVCILRFFDKGTIHETFARERLAALQYTLKSPLIDAERRDCRLF